MDILSQKLTGAFWNDISGFKAIWFWLDDLFTWLDLIVLLHQVHQAAKKHLHHSAFFAKLELESPPLQLGSSNQPIDQNSNQKRVSLKGKLLLVRGSVRSGSGLSPE